MYENNNYRVVIYTDFKVHIFLCCHLDFKKRGSVLGGIVKKFNFVSVLEARFQS